jgi:hypothetical protein
VFTARYALSPYIKQIRFVFKGLISATVEDRVTFKLHAVKLADERLETGTEICKLPTLNAWAMKIFWTNGKVL